MQFDVTRLSETWATLREALSAWSNDNVPRLAAALAYYSLLALAPLLVLGVSVTSWVVGADAAREQLAVELSRFIGKQASSGIDFVLAQAQTSSASSMGNLIGIAVLLIGASGVFVELRAALNTVWDIPPRQGSLLVTELRDRLWSLLMVLGAALVLLIVLLASVLTSGLSDVLAPALPGGEWLLQVLNFIASSIVVTLLFALLFKYVADAVVQWRDVITGAWVTALLFTIGKTLLGLYLGKVAVGSAYGAAGALIVLVVWVYYSAFVLFLGAEYVQAHARRQGRELVPRGNRERRADQSSRATHEANMPQRDQLG
jgi:membrane protein